MSEMSDAVRCGMCGRENPADAAVCEHCGARLKPLLPEESAGEAGPAGDDLLEGLRAQFGDLTEPSGEPAEPEPDFVFGWSGEESAGPGSPPSDDLPGWLQDLGISETTPSRPEPPTPEPDLPDWLADLAKGEPQEEPPSSAEPAVPEAEIPDWLADLAGEEPEAEPEPPVSAEPAVPEAEIPDWLADLAGEEPEAEPEPPVSAEPPVPSRADWPGTFRAAPEDEGKAGIPAALMGGGLPSWLGGTQPPSEIDAPLPEPETARPPEITEEPEPLPAPEAGAEPAFAEEEAVPDWLAAISAPQPMIPSAEAEEVREDGPDWLAELDTPEAVLSTAEPAAFSEEAELDWLDRVDLAAGIDQPVPLLSAEEVQGEDLLGLSGDLLAAPEVEPETAEEPEPDLGELPDWLQGLREVAGEAPGPVAASGDVDPALLEQIQDLRFEQIAGEEPDSDLARAEKVGALKDVTGVIQPELIFEGSSLTSARPREAVVLSERQTRQIQLIERLLAQETGPAGPASRRRYTAPVVRWLVAILLLLTVGAPLLAAPNFFSFSRASQDVLTAHGVLETLASEPSMVLVAFEYEPDTAAEIAPLAEALLGHLAGQEAVTVYTISTLPTGPALAQELLASEGIRHRLETNGGTWTNLGYIPGRASGINALVIGSPPGLPSPLAFDYIGQPTGIQAARLPDAGVDLIIVLAARPENLRAWIEQAGRPAGVPVLAALSAGAAPLAQPYRASGQVVAVLGGINDAVAYRAVSRRPADPAVLFRWNAQALGSAAAAVLIVLGGLVYGVSSSQRQRRRDP